MNVLLCWDWIYGLAKKWRTAVRSRSCYFLEEIFFQVNAWFLSSWLQKELLSFLRLFEQCTRKLQNDVKRLLRKWFPEEISSSAQSMGCRISVTEMECNRSGRDHSTKEHFPSIIVTYGNNHLAQANTVAMSRSISSILLLAAISTRLDIPGESITVW